MKHVLLAAVLGASIGVAHAADEPDSTQPVSAAQSFVTKASQDALTEIQLGELAQQRSSDPKVKAFAARMIQDHTKANAELSALAKRKSLEVTTELDDKHATMLHAVGTKPPSEFDAEYAKHMVEAHDAAVTMFKDAAAIGDKDISGFAKKTLPTIQKHRELAVGLPTTRSAPAAAREPGSPQSPDGSEPSSR